jgi:polyketide synthase Type III
MNDDGSWALPRIIGVGTAVPTTSYTQEDLLNELRITDQKVRSVFLNSGIKRRHLVLPPTGADGTRIMEEHGDLLDKHKKVAVEMAAAAVEECLKRANASLRDIAHLCCVTSTGFLTPGLTALLIRELGIDPHVSRCDIVGMGCNAGLNALGVVTGWATAHPGRLAIVVCAEACSAAYAIDATMRTAVVNSLFGDGAAAFALRCDDTRDAPPDWPRGPQVIETASLIIIDAIEAMRYDWDREQGRLSFFLDPQIPYVVGAHAERIVDRVLARSGLRRRDISHWLVHSGGKKVIDAVAVNLGLTRHDLRHTRSVLRDYGNVSSGSFMFSYERLLEEGITEPGEYGVLMTMGPGSTIEAALVKW